MDLSIIIVNWNSVDYLRACLSSIYRETGGITFEVIVIDNASSDGCEGVIREEFPNVVLIQSTENLGFARANNLGYTRSSAAILLFLNPDTEIRQDVFTKMVGHLRSYPSAGAVGARLLNSDGSLQSSCVQAYPTIWNQLLDSELLRRAFPSSGLWGMKPLFSDGDEPAEIDAISGACFMVKRGVFEQAGLFSEDYFMYVEDLDLSYRIRKTGYSIYYLNGCPVVHHGGRSAAKQEAYFPNLRQQESLLQFFRTTRGDWYSKLYRVALAAAAATRIVLAVCSIPFGRFGFRSKTPASVLHKWSRILHWAVGLESWSTPRE
jgi:hypothetical protein